MNTQGFKINSEISKKLKVRAESGWGQGKARKRKVQGKGQGRKFRGESGRKVRTGPGTPGHVRHANRGAADTPRRLLNYSIWALGTQ